MVSPCSPQPLSRALSIALFVAILATACSLGAALAHALELPNKIELSRDQYFIVQQIYAGWDRLAAVLAIQLASIVTVLILSRRQPRVFRATLVALGGLIAAQALFWTFTYPANVATNNWTAIPSEWEFLRVQWEYSHAVGAACQFIAMAALAVAALTCGRSAARA